jgi:polar amino acid transport system substrate-binding protein
MRRSAFLAAALAQGALLPLLPAARAAAQSLELPAGRLRQGTVAGSQIATITVELGKAFADRLRMPYEEINYGSDIERTQGLNAGVLDLVNVARPNVSLDPLLDYSAAFLEIDSTYLVPSGSPIQRVADADRPGMRIAATQGSAPDTYLSEALKQATLVRGASQAAAFELLRSGQADAFGALRSNLLALAPQMAGSRVLPDRFSVQPTSLGVPKGRPALAAAMRDFVTDAVASGLVRQIIARSGVQGIQAAVLAQLPRTGSARPATDGILFAGPALLALGLALRRLGTEKVSG